MSEVTTSALEAIHPLLLNSGALQRPELPVAGNALLGSVSELDDRIRAMEQRYLPKE
jgi:hypothetical protein